MADFTVLVASGAALRDWLDPPKVSAPAAPSRLNARPGYPMKRWVGTRGVPVVLKAVVGGVVAPIDASLGGRLFSAWPVEAPDAATPFAGIIGTPSHSAIQTVYAAHAGHYTIGIRRTDGGCEHVHLDIA